MAGIARAGLLPARTHPFMRNSLKPDTHGTKARILISGPASVHYLPT